MNGNGFFSKLIGGLLQILFILGILWGEFAGIYHAFAHHGTRDGFISVFIPPYSWYRSIDFIFWLSRDGLTRSEKDELGHFIESLALNRKAINMINEEMSKQGFVGTIDEKIEKETINLRRKSLKESQNIRDEVLSKLHPELPSHYRDEFCEGIKIYLQGWEEFDPQLSIKGQWLHDKWGDWYNEHLHELRAKYSGKKVKELKTGIQSGISERESSSEVGMPRMSQEEIEVMLPILLKAAIEPINKDDIMSLHNIFLNYCERIEIPKEAHAYISEFFAGIIEVPAEYHYELKQCLLLSIESNKPIITHDLEKLKEKMEMFGFGKEHKFKTDLKRIEAAGRGEAWTDIFGNIHAPITRKEVLAEIQMAKTMIQNYKKISEEFKKLSRNHD